MEVIWRGESARPERMQGGGATPRCWAWCPGEGWAWEGPGNQGGSGCLCSGQDPPCFGNPKTHAGPHHGLCQPLDFQAHPGFVESGKTHDPRRVRGRSCCHHGDGHAWLAGLERAGAGHNVSCHGQRPGPMRALESAPPDSARPLALGLHPEKARCTPVPATLATLHCAHAGLGSTRAATGLTSATSFTSSSTTSSSRSAWVFFGWGERGGGKRRGRAYQPAPVVCP